MRTSLPATRLVRKLTFLAISSFLFVQTEAQLTGTHTVPGSYPTIAAAVTALNTQGVGAGGVTIDVAAGHTETATALISLTATGTAANPIIIRKDPATIGVNPKIIARDNNGGLVTNSTSGEHDGIFRLSGADYVTIDAIDLEENPLNTTDGERMEFGYGLFRATTTNGCQNVTIQNCVVTMDRAYIANVNNATADGSCGIMVSSALVTSNTFQANATSAAGAQSNIKIRSNTVQNCHTGIHVAGSSSLTNQDNGNEIGGAGTGNSIRNYGGGGATAGAAPAVGIRFSEQTNFSVSFNSIENNNGSGINHDGPVQGIFFESGNDRNVTISQNTIKVTGASVSLNVTAIEISTSAGGTAGVLNITGNTIQNCSTPSGAAPTAQMHLIDSRGTMGTLNITGNLVTNNTSNGSGEMNIIRQIAGNSTSHFQINNNIVSGNVKNTNASGAMYCIRTSSGASFTCSGNTVSGNTVNNSGVSQVLLYGIYLGSSSVTETYSNNTISNQVVNSSGTGGAEINGIYGLISSNNRTITGNVISGLQYVSTTGSGATIHGYFCNGGSNTFTKNKMYDFSADRGSSRIVGVQIQQTTADINLVNNLIGNFSAPAANSSPAVLGINVQSGGQVKIYYNTVYLSGTPTSTSFGSTALQAFTSGITSLDLRNNILVNKMTAGSSSGQSVSYRRNGANFSNYALSSDNNLFYVTPAARHYLYFDGSSGDQTIAAYKARVGSNRDEFSVSEDPPLLSTTGSSPDYLHISPAIATSVESGGAAVAGYDDDYDGHTRQGSPGYAGSGVAPDIGADEFEGTPNITCFPPGTPNTAGIQHNTATFSWTAGNLATGYEWELRTGNSCSGGSVVQSGTTGSLNVTLTGLSGNTQYTFCVRSNCGAGGNSTWSSATFTTLCDPNDISAATWTYGFEGTTVGINIPPSCWFIEGGNWWNANTSILGGTDPHSGSMYLATTQGGVGNRVIWLPRALLNAGSSYDFGVWYEAVTNSVSLSFDVLYNTAPTSSGASQMGSSVTLPAGSPTAYQQLVRTFTVPSTGIYYIGLRVNSNNEVGFDDFSLGVTANCTAPSGLNITNITGSTATISWGSTPAGSYQYAITNSTAAPLSGTPTNATSVNVTGLSPVTTYYLQVRSDCGGGLFSTWTISLPFETTLECSAATNISGCGVPQTASIAGGAGGYNNYGTGVCTGSQSGKEVLFTFTPSVTGMHTISITSATNNQSVSWMYKEASATCDETGWSCIANISGISNWNFGPLNAGTTYYIIADGNTQLAGTYQFQITCPISAPVNDECASAITVTPQPYSLTCSSPTAAVTTGATQSAEALGICSGAGANDDIWYSFTATSTAHVVRFSNLVATSGTPTTIGYALYSGTCGTLAQVSCVNSFGSAGSGVSPSISGLVVGQTYKLRLFATGNNNSASFDFCVQDAAPANNQCIDAQPLTMNGALLTGQTTDQSSQEIAPNTCSGNTAATALDVWYRFVANSSVAIITVTGDGGFDAVVEIMSNPCSGTTAISCVNATGSGGTETLTVTGLNPSGTYFFRVYDFDGNATLGSFSVGVATPGVAPGTPESCETEPTITIDNSNRFGWIAMRDASGNLVAEINTNGQSLGQLNTNLFVNTDAVREDEAGRAYLNRNFNIITTVAPSSTVSVRLYFTDAELDALTAADPSVVNPGDLAIFRNNENCGGELVGSAARISQSGNNTYPGNNYVISFNTPALGSFFLANTTFSVLPVRIQSFSGERSGNVNVLRWTTSEEQNAAGYHVERSINGSDFISIGYVPSQAQGGFSSNTLRYQFSDQGFTGYKQYYRLRQVDLDGRTSYSTMIWITGDKSPVLTLTGLYPNPVISELKARIESPEREEVKLVITDITGRILKQRTAVLDKGVNSIDWNIRDISSGTYILQVICNNGCERINGKFVKK